MAARTDHSETQAVYNIMLTGVAFCINIIFFAETQSFQPLHFLHPVSALDSFKKKKKNSLNIFLSLTYMYTTSLSLDSHRKKNFRLETTGMYASQSCEFPVLD
jgi:hypothetical protein